RSADMAPRHREASAGARCSRVLDALHLGLLPMGSEPPARHLCQLCEVKDERWRPAIDVAFTRKFAIVVDPDHYDKAESIYYGLKLHASGQRESLVNPAKALKLARPIQKGSL